MGTRTRKVKKGNYLNYVRKSDEFYRSAEDATRRGDWSAAVSNAVHSAISAVDALTVFYAGERSTAQSRDETVKLLSTLKMDRVELDRSIKRLSSLLEVKNLAEYEDRLPAQKDAGAAMRNVERLRRWVLSKLPSPI